MDESYNVRRNIAQTARPSKAVLQRKSSFEKRGESRVARFKKSFTDGALEKELESLETKALKEEIAAVRNSLEATKMEGEHYRLALEAARREGEQYKEISERAEGEKLTLQAEVSSLKIVLRDARLEAEDVRQTLGCLQNLP